MVPGAPRDLGAFGCRSLLIEDEPWQISGELKECDMLQAALLSLVLGLVVWWLAWTGLAEMPTQVYWGLTGGGMLLMLVHVATRRPARTW